METPNQEHLNEFIGNLEERYQFEKLKDWEKRRLEGEIYLVQNEFARFRTTFPSNDSIWQGELRTYAFGVEDSRKSLTETERTRLDQAQRNIEAEIKRAIGYKEREKRKHRSELLNGVVDIFEAIKISILGLWSTVRQLVPWK